MTKAQNPRQIHLSKRANVFYLDRARVMKKDERIVYMTDRDSDFSQFFNIPERNTSLLLLGKGSSITDAAARKLAESNVVVGFCGSGGTPLIAAVDAVFMCPQSEYRPTEYMQKWAEKWFAESSRIEMARELIHKRIFLCKQAWADNPATVKRGIRIPERAVSSLQTRTEQGKTSQDILLAEAEWAKSLYAVLARSFSVDFTRNPGAQKTTSIPDKVNSFLDQGNYLAYGLAAVALHGLGISFSFPLLHGKTRRGALVFDIADLIKDAYVMPCAFEYGAESKATEKDFRSALIERFHDSQALDQLFDITKEIALR